LTVAVIVLALVVAALLYDRATTRVATERERARLIQRIVAPERAAAAQSRSEAVEPERRRYVPIALDDDKAMTRARGEEEDDDDGS
jgi:hypothetical protein